MNPIAFLPVALLASPPKNWFDDCLRAHRAMRAGNVHMEVDQLLEGRRTRAQYDMSFVRPDQVLLRIREPEQNNRGATDRSFVLLPERFYGYDAVVRERLERGPPTEGSLSQKLGTAIGSQLDDMVAGMIDPERLESFLGSFRNTTGWKSSIKGGIASLSKQSLKGKSNTASFRFEAASNRLRGMSALVGNGHLNWTLKYGSAPKAVTFRPPADAARVESFTQRPASAKYANSKSKAVAERAVSAYDRLKHVNFKVQGVGGGVQAWISDKWVREESSSMAYVWDHQIATIRDSRRKTMYSGRAGTASLLNALAALGSRMDPVVRQIVTRQNPIRVLRLPHVKVRYVGPNKGNMPGDVLEFKTSNVTVTMVIRKDNGLLASIHTTVQDLKGRILSDAMKSYVYGSVGKPIDKGQFNLPSPGGYQKQPITALSK